MIRLILLAAVCVLMLVHTCRAQPSSQPAAASPGPLPEWTKYVSRPDPISKWTVGVQRSDGDAKFFEAQLISQDWGGVWEHKIQAYSPAKPLADDLAVIFMMSQPSALGTLADAANKIGLPCANLGGFPCKSFGQVGEAGLLAGTMIYFKTGDPNYATFCPLVRAAVRTMDCIEAESPKALGKPIKRFILVGHSKAGGTAWWSAILDPRVAGIVVVGADLLNIKAQDDIYPTINLEQFLPKGTLAFDREAFMKMLYTADPYQWRAKLTVPKLVIQGANDEHFVTGATGLYYDNLPGGKWVLNLPNATHGGAGQAGEMPNTQTADTLVAMAKSIATKKPLPQLNGKFVPANDKLTVTVDCPAAAKQALLWSAQSSSRDFRYSKWTSQEMKPVGSPAWTAKEELHIAKEKHHAVFVSVELEQDGQTFWLSTLIEVMKADEGK